MTANGLPPYSLHNEKELLQRLAGGDQDAFTLLFYQHKEKIFYFCLSITQSPAMAEDITQDIFMTVWKERATLQAVDYFRSWLKTVARNKAINAIKKLAQEKAVLNSLQQPAAHSEATLAEDSLLGKQYLLLMQQAINQLPDHQKEVFLLSRKDELEYAEIARRMSISVNTVKYHMKAAFKSIRMYLQQHGAELFILFLIYF